MIRSGVPLAPLTTMGVGGPARWFAEARNSATLTSCLDWAAAVGVPVFILGGGSNVVFSDAGFDGLVLNVRITGVLWPPGAGEVLVEAGAGEDWDAFVGSAVSRGLAGLECLSGIPGNVGATPVQNVGAYGQEVASAIVSVKAFDRSSGQRVRIGASQCGFGYRTSVFKEAMAGRFIITSVIFRLTADGPPLVRYADLVRYFETETTREAPPTLAEVRDAVLTVRRAKAMVYDTDNLNSRGCGSFFVNPVLTTAELEKMTADARRRGILGTDETVPHHPSGQDTVKLSAAWLLEKAGMRRGRRHGNAGISEKHALAIVNLGGATAAEVIDLMHIAQERVAEIWGVALQPEPVLAGF